MNDGERPESRPAVQPLVSVTHADDELERLGSSPGFRAELERLAELAPPEYASRLRRLAEER
jgi:hypothetical protein